MTFLEMQAELQLLLGNLQTNDPLVSATDMRKTWINRAKDRVPQLVVGGNHRNLNLFYEHQTSWTSTATTTAAQAYMGLPSDLLVLTDVQQFKTSSAVNLSVDQTYPMSFIPWKEWAILAKGTSVTGWPRLWSRRGNRVYIHPTPSSSPTDYRTYLLYIGVQKEPDLSADGATLVMAAQWHPIIVKYAAYLGYEAMGDHEEAKIWKASALDEINLTVDFSAIEEAVETQTISSDRMPTRLEVMGP